MISSKSYNPVWELVKGGRSVFCTGILFLETGTWASKRLKTGKNRRAFDDGSGLAALPRTWHHPPLPPPILTCGSVDAFYPPMECRWGRLWYRVARDFFISARQDGHGGQAWVVEGVWRLQQQAAGRSTTSNGAAWGGPVPGGAWAPAGRVWVVLGSVCPFIPQIGLSASAAPQGAAAGARIGRQRGSRTRRDNRRRRWRRGRGQWWAGSEERRRGGGGGRRCGGVGGSDGSGGGGTDVEAAIQQHFLAQLP